MQTFSRQQIKQHFSQAAPAYDEAAILQKTVAERLDERLDLIAMQPQTICDLGAGTGLLTQKVRQRYPNAQVFAVDLSVTMLHMAQPRLQQPRLPFLGHKLNTWLQQQKSTKPLFFKPHVQAINADVYQLPFADNSLDLITSSLMLQWCDDLDQVFAELRRVLRPEGLLIFTTFGPDTLKELRLAWSQADAAQQQSNQDVTEHVNFFIDMHDIGDALIRNGFGQPVMDMELFTLTYATPMAVLKDLKAIGATNASQQQAKGLMGKQRFTRMLDAYESFRRASDLTIPASYEVVHGHAWAAPENFKGPNRDRSGHVEISLDQFADQVKAKQDR